MGSVRPAFERSGLQSAQGSATFTKSDSPKQKPTTAPCNFLKCTFWSVTFLSAKPCHLQQLGPQVTISREADRKPSRVGMGSTSQEWSWLQSKRQPGAGGVPGKPAHDRDGQVQTAPRPLPREPGLASPRRLLG